MDKQARDHHTDPGLSAPGQGPAGTGTGVERFRIPWAGSLRTRRIRSLLLGVVYLLAATAVVMIADRATPATSRPHPVVSDVVHTSTPATRDPIGHSTVATAITVTAVRYVPEAVRVR